MSDDRFSFIVTEILRQFYRYKYYKIHIENLIESPGHVTVTFYKDVGSLPEEHKIVSAFKEEFSIIAQILSIHVKVSLQESLWKRLKRIVQLYKYSKIFIRG